MIYDIIIIGSGLSGLYCGYTIKKNHPTKSFMILEKSSQCNIGGRAGTKIFYNNKIAIGAGVGRKDQDKLLYLLLTELGFSEYEITENQITINYAKSMDLYKINENEIIKIIDQMIKIFELNKNKYSNMTFKNFAIKIIGKKMYEKFKLSLGYTDYENQDVNEVLYHYGIKDNVQSWKSFNVPWSKLISKLYKYIGLENFVFSSEVVEINKNDEIHNVMTIDGKNYKCKKIIIASTVDTIRNLLPTRLIYSNIEGQNFMRVYAKFDDKSIPIMKKYIKGLTYVNSLL